MSSKTDDLKSGAEAAKKTADTSREKASKPAVSPGKFAIDHEKLIETVQTVQFAWFIGHLFTLLGTFYFILTYFGIFSSWYKIWYNLAVFGIIESFGILIYQHFRKVGTKNLINDDNVHYYGLGVMLLILRPYIIFPILPFQLYSLFHVLSYTKGYLLPIFNQQNTSIEKMITNFVNSNNQKSIQLASLLELVCLGFLGLRVIFFRKRSLTPFVIYLIFIKLRYEKSPVTRSYFKFISTKLDSTITGLNNPTATNIWSQVKSVFARVDNFVLVNDYKKNKVN
ncbi:pore membrane protein of 33 kDa [[Candida] jaroonii]|uniref:Pore membrane protein of 33 kDa n=1 Tax=[Candida] jaroonii TaxID=467808 RepID=A0ACA9YBH1_9ASCO|nr:pore membrane protein of 33 kDa [[Candida] jaroonii]